MATDPTEKTAEEQAATTEVAVENKALEDFSWDDGSDDFFGIEGTAPVVDEVKEIVKEVTTPEADTTTETEEEEVEEKKEEDEDFFGVKETKEGVFEEVEREEIPDENNLSNFKTLASKMKEDGIFHNIEISEDEEITEEKFIELQDQEIESRVDEAFEGFFKELDEDAAAFLKFKKEGGNTSEFFKVYGQNVGAPSGDLDDESYQEKVSRYYYANIDGDDSDDIDDKIEWLKDSGKLAKYAEKFDTKIKEREEKSKEDLQAKAKAAEKSAKEGRINFVNTVQEALDNTDKVDNFIFTPQSKKSLLPFITKQTVKVGKNKYITPMQSKLGTALKDPEKMLVLAQLLENDFDVTTILANAETVTAKRIKKDIQRKGAVKPTGSGRVGKKKSLSDFF